MVLFYTAAGAWHIACDMKCPPCLIILLETWVLETWVLETWVLETWVQAMYRWTTITLHFCTSKRATTGNCHIRACQYLRNLATIKIASTRSTCSLPNTLPINKFSGTSRAGRVAPAQGDPAVARDGSTPDGAVDFCNTPGGYHEMGGQLGLAFASMVVPATSSPQAY